MNNNILNIDSSILDDLIIGRVEPYIYAFSTNTIPNYLKVGDTYRPVDTRIKEWKKYFPNLVKEFSAPAKIDNNTIFRDYAVHSFLIDERGRERLLPNTYPDIVYYSKEFFKNATIEDLNDAIQDIQKSASENLGRYQLYTTNHLPITFTYKRNLNYTPRPNQLVAINNFKNAVNSGRTNLLMYAVMRFGKSFTAMCCALEVHASFILIVSAKADVKNEWKKTVESHVNFKDYIFSDTNTLKTENNYVSTNLKQGRKIVLFLTLQDLQGKEIKKHHKDIFSCNIDLLIVDETHYGARAEEYGRVLLDSNLTKREIENELQETDCSEQYSCDELKQLKSKIRLHLSGTPYRILMGSEFTKKDIISFCQFTDIVSEQEKWNNEHILDDNTKEWDNPYYGFPQMIRFAFHPSKLARKKIDELKKNGQSASLSDIFRPKSLIKTRDNSYKFFEHQEEVLDLMQVIDGSKQDDEVLGFLDYEKIKEGQMCRHIVCVLPFRASCDALEHLIQNNLEKFKNISKYSIVNIAGVDALNRFPEISDIKKYITKCETEGKKTITLTVNRMLTGSTVEEWDTMLYLKNSASPQEYDQSIFRLQNQYIKSYIDEKGDEIKYNMKPQTILVDFDPARMFTLQELKSQFYNVNTEQNGNSRLEERLRKELEISPIIVLNKNKLSQVTPINILDLVRQYTKDKSVIDEANEIPIDYSILSNELIVSAIQSLSPIDSSKGLNFIPIEEDDDDYDDPGPSGDSSEKGPNESDSDGKTTKNENKENEPETLNKKLSTYFSMILFFAFLTNSEVKSLEDIIRELTKTEENKRIGRNIGLRKSVLQEIQNKMYPFILSKLDYKIQNINSLMRDNTLLPIERAKIAMNKFGRLSSSEIVTPADVVNKVVNLLPIDKISTETRILDIASKQGEFSCILYEKLGTEMRNNIYAIATSKIAYEFTVKIYNILGLPISNVLSEFNSYDLLENEKLIKKLQKMNFDIVIGNPPYQLEGASGGNNDAPIYQTFAKIATSISTQYVSLIIKSAWFTTGRENLLRDFRHHMLTSRTVSRLVVYPNSRILFPDVEIKGGCCFYLEDKKYRGKCKYTLVNNGIEETSMRNLDAFDVLIRDPKVSAIIEKIDDFRKKKGYKTVDTIISADTPFGIPSNPRTSKKTPCKVYSERQNVDDVLLYHIQNGKRLIEYMSINDIRKNVQDIPKYKVFVTGAGGSGNDKKILGRPVLAEKNSVCSQSYLYSAFESKEEAVNFEKYLRTKFLRFIVSSIKITQSASNRVYRFVPLINLNEEISDSKLYEFFKLTKEEIEIIENSIDIL